MLGGIWAAGFGFYKTTEDSPFSTAGNAHLVLGGAHVVVQFLAIVASCAVLIGALPLIGAALGQARRVRDLRSVVSSPIVAVAVFAVLTGGLVVLAHRESAHHASTAASAALSAWILAGCACGAVCVVASRKALFAVPVPRRRLGSALAWGTVVTAAIAAIALGMQAVVMLASASLATVTTLRGWRALGVNP